MGTQVGRCRVAASQITVHAESGDNVLEGFTAEVAEPARS